MKRIFASIALLLVVSSSALAADSAAKAAATLEKAQKFLVSQQQPDGGWQRSPQEPPGITALVVQGLALDPNYGPNHPVVKKGYQKLISYQQADGGIYKDMLQTYNTAIAVSALSA